MSSCGNIESNGEALMQGRPRFDRSIDCIKCKLQRGNIVIRHAVYCKKCFVPLVTTKFRRCLDPHINQIPDGPRRGALKASGSLLVGFSGGLGSTVLLDILTKNYFPSKLQEDGTDSRGGKSHPRNKKVWEKAYVCYVETSSAFTEGQSKDRSEDVRATIGYREDFELLLARLEDAFDREWWERVGNGQAPIGIGIDLSDEELPIFKKSSALKTTDREPAMLLRSYISSLPTPTAVQSAISTLIRVVLLYTACHLGCSHLALGTSLTSLSISLINSIAQGSGFNIPEESYEEWKGHSPLRTDESAAATVRIVRPLRDVGMKECAAWTWWQNLSVIGKEKLYFSSKKQTIGGLTKGFIVGLERDYPSTVSTIARTCTKVTPKDDAIGHCALCERPLPGGVLDWKSRISIRGPADMPLTAQPINPNAVSADPAAFPGNAGRLATGLCYACHTMLTSKSSRSSQLTQSSLVHLPTWASSRLTKETYPAEESRRSGLMSRTEMKNTVDEFLLED